MEEQSFETAMARLDEINELLSGAVPLADALKYYQEAAGLAAFCDEQLKNAELVVEEHKSAFFEADDGE